MKNIIPLVAYLPYKVKIVNVGHSPFKIFTLIHAHNGYWNEDKIPMTAFSNGGEEFVDQPHLKMVLRKLEDFDIEFFEDLIENAECDAEIDFINALLNDKKSMLDKMKFAPYSIIQSFLKAHGDIFGLIPKGKAIDIKTLNL